MSTEVEVMPVNPADVYAAGQAAACVRRAVDELEDIEQDLPALIRMDWYSPAALEFAELLGGHIQNVAATLEDLRLCADAVERHVAEIRAHGHEVP
ncbi:hypothetical protein OL239_01745 [Arthrobacter sp. ATA002]|uniref:hypothetical protein n=1 Tax=Arthrobacter sp. ATA002 TaxID=2991715 RepID=UPI0022A7DFB3|nr:hypothetical protein [Arthrobacter sp. ATA002]WAP52072.1 hypothetical protein OL239_01745 [Arthrobacter sp. ATA002]